MLRPDRLLPLAASAVLLSLLAGCDRGPATSPAADATAGGGAVSAPDAKPGLNLTGGRLVLPAVRGNPAAVYFTLVNGNGKPVTVAAVDVAGAGMAMLHETMEMDGHSSMGELKNPVVPAGGKLDLAPGGKHVMVADIPADWAPGGQAELTVTFADGDKLSAPVRFEAPGGDGGDGH